MYRAIEILSGELPGSLRRVSPARTAPILKKVDKRNSDLNDNSSQNRKRVSYTTTWKDQNMKFDPK